MAEGDEVEIASGGWLAAFELPSFLIFARIRRLLVIINNLSHFMSSGELEDFVMLMADVWV